VPPRMNAAGILICFMFQSPCLSARHKKSALSSPIEGRPSNAGRQESEEIVLEYSKPRRAGGWPTDTTEARVSLP